MAVDDVNENKTMLKNYDLSLDIKDGKCEPDVVMKMFIDIIRTKAISRFSSTVGVLGLNDFSFKITRNKIPIYCRSCLFKHCRSHCWCFKALSHGCCNLQCKRLNLKREQ